MAMKICSRCYFAVNGKRRSCDTCGNKTFISESILAVEPEAPDFKDKLRNAWQELHGELISTSGKSLRAAKRFVQTLNQRRAQGGSR